MLELSLPMYKKLIYNLDGQGVGTFSANVYFFGGGEYFL